MVTFIFVFAFLCVVAINIVHVPRGENHLHSDAKSYKNFQVLCLIFSRVSEFKDLFPGYFATVICHFSSLSPDGVS